MARSSCAAGLWPLPDVAADASRATPAAPGVSADRRAVATAQATYAAAASRDLRRSLTDAPVTGQSAPAQPANAGLPVRLVGTIVDASRPRGIFVTILGQMELRGVGEKAGGAEVLRVDERTATLLVAGQPVTIKVEKPGDGNVIPGFTVEAPPRRPAGVRRGRDCQPACAGELPWTSRGSSEERAEFRFSLWGRPCGAAAGRSCLWHEADKNVCPTTSRSGLRFAPHPACRLLGVIR